MPLYEMTPEEAREFNRKHPFHTTLIFGARPTCSSVPRSGADTANDAQASGSSAGQTEENERDKQSTTDADCSKK